MDPETGRATAIDRMLLTEDDLEGPVLRRSRDYGGVYSAAQVANPRKAPVREELAGLGASVLDALPIGLYVVDRGLRVVAWNRPREKGPFGSRAARCWGGPCSASFPRAASRDRCRILEKVFATGETHEQTVEAHGAPLPRAPAARERRAAGSPTCCRWFEDITEQRALEMRLIASDRLAFLGQLVAGVAHEVSNPLAGIAGCAEALASLALKPGGAKDARTRPDCSAT